MFYFFSWMLGIQVITTLLLDLSVYQKYFALFLEKNLQTYLSILSFLNHLWVILTCTFE